MDMSYALKTISVSCEIKQIRGALRPYICQFNRVSMAHCKLVSKVNLHKLKSTFIWQVVEAVDYK